MMPRTSPLSIIRAVVLIWCTPVGAAKALRADTSSSRSNLLANSTPGGDDRGSGFAWPDLGSERFTDSSLDIGALPDQAVGWRERDAATVDMATRQDGPGLEESDVHAPPELWLVALTVMLTLLGILLLDVTAHLLSQLCEDDHKREHLDWYLDGAAASLGMIASFSCYSVAQEYVLTHHYETGLLPSPAILLFTSRCVTVVCAGTCVYLWGERPGADVTWRTSFPGIVNLFGSYLEDFSLLYIPYPVVAVFKSSKLVPTMLVNTVINREFYGPTEYFIALLAVTFVSAFTLSTLSSSHGGAIREPAFLGVIFALLSVLTDALTSTSQKWIFNKYPSFSNAQMMLVMGTYGLMLAAVVVGLSPGYYEMYNFVSSNPTCIPHMFLVGIASTLGTYFIYYIIHYHGPIALSFVIIFRQVSSIVMSSILYHHPMTLLSFLFLLGALLVITSKPVLMAMQPPQKITKPLPLRSLLVATESVYEYVADRHHRFRRTRTWGPQSPTWDDAGDVPEIGLRSKSHEPPRRGATFSPGGAGLDDGYNSLGRFKMGSIKEEEGCPSGDESPERRQDKRNSGDEEDPKVK